MSGSPIVQNGKLIGAVTHVLVGDPTRGYGIFIENMMKTAASVADGGVVKHRYATIPQSKIKDFCQPPLYKGPWKGGNTMDFYNIPIGFGLALSSNTAAMNRYAHMTESQKKAILNKAHNARSEQEMHDLVNSLSTKTF